MAIDSILALIDAEIARLTQVRSLLAATGKVAAKVTARLAKKTAKAQRPRRLPKAHQEGEEAPHVERRSAQADCRCAAQALGRTEGQGQVRRATRGIFLTPRRGRSPDRCASYSPAITSMRGSVISSMAERIPSRPNPESLTPPKGMGSRRQLGVSPTIKAPTSSSR